MSNETFTIEDALFKLQEIGLNINELKKYGHKTITIDAYEKLLDWTIECLRNINDVCCQSVK